MPKVITDEKKIDELLSRGVESVYPNKKELKKKLMSGDRIKLYCGFDPSASALHIGNAIQINKLSQFQNLGHEVVFLVGDFTGMIGDPTDKSSARVQLDRKTVLENSKSYQKQASAYLDFEGANPAVVDYNSRWSDKMTFKDLIEISSNFTVQQMIVRDMFRKRLEEDKPIYLHEFLYPLAQGYDSVAMDVDLELGGNDQMFNMMAGRDLQRAVNNREKFVVTTKLLADDKGKKMGKSEGNAVFLDTDPNNMYGIIMSWPDEVIGVAFELCTKIPTEEVNEIKCTLKTVGVNPRDYKMKLAHEITKINHGEEKADEAQEHFVKTVQNKEIPDDIPEIKIKDDKLGLLNLLVKVKLVSSKGEAKRLVAQGGIKINEEVKKDEKEEITLTGGMIIQRGKRQFVKIVK